MKARLARAYEHLVLRHPRLVLALLAAILALFATGVPRFELDASADALLLENDVDLHLTRRMTTRYGAQEFLFVAVVPPHDILAPSTLELVRGLRDELAALEGVDRVISLLDVPLVLNTDGTLSEVTTNYKTLEMPDVDKARAREELTSSPLYEDLVASADGSVTALQILLKDHPRLPRLRERRDALIYKRMTDGLAAAERTELARLRPAYERAKEEADAANQRLIEQIRAIMRRHEGETELFLGGLPMIADDMISYIRNDLVVFGGGAFVFLVLMLALIFREARWVVLPLASCLYAGTIVIGLLGLIGWKVTVISSNFVALMLIITMSMNIHLVVRYRELYRDHPDAGHFELVRLTTRHMALPCLYTALTTIIAFSSLVVSDIKPVIDFGWMMTIGLATLFITTFTLFPALLLLGRKRALRRPEGDTYAFTAALGRVVERRGTGVLVLSVLLGIAGITGMQRLEVENSFVSYFHEDTEIYQGLRLIDNKLGGTTPLEILLKFRPVEAPEPPGAADEDLAELFGGIESETREADVWFTPAKIERIETIHDYLDSLPGVGKVLSLASGLRVAEEITGSDFTAFELNVIYKRLPPPVRAELVDPYVSIDNDEARISARIIDTMPDLRRKDLLETIDRDLRVRFGLGPDEYEITGLMVLYNNVLQSLFRSQILTLGAVMAGIMIMLTILFRSLTVAAVGILPNVLAATSILGFMGWMNIPLDVMTITIAAITIGIAVDDCIHYLYRYKSEYPRIGDPLETMHYCHANIAKAAFYTTITVTVGFSILVLSNFIPTILFGILTALAMIVALLAALTLMPKLILMWKPFGPS